jgi:cytoskeletal protein RodZ
MNDRSSIDAPSVEATSAIAAAPPIAAAAPITAAAVVAAAVAPTARHAVPRTPRNEPNRVALNRITSDRAPSGAKPAAATKTPKPPKPPKPPKLPEEKSGDRPPDRRGSRKILGWTMVGLGVVILGGMAWVGLRTYQAYSHLQNASTDVTELQAQLTDITNSDPAVIGATVAHLQDESAAAHSAVNDPIYRVATAVPFLGANLDAIRTVTVTVDSLATDVMPSLVNVAQKLQPAEIAPKDGTINLAPIKEISPLLQSADIAVNAALQNLATIDQSSVIQPVGEAVQTLSTKLANAADVTGPGARTARLLPPMLGSEGPRNYLVVFQNPAELRSTGGIFGSFALMTADNGKITISDQSASSRSIGTFGRPVTPLSQSEINLYTDEMAMFPQDVNFSPDFPTAAALFTQMYQAKGGGQVDGVLAIDPVALSYTLKGAPPIDVGDGLTVTSDNLVSTLLSTAYQKFDDADQERRDAFLDSATSKVFSVVMSGQGQSRSIIDGLRKAANERRVLVYSSNPTEQDDIATTGLAGIMSTDTSQPTVGVFMNDGTAAKLGYYLHNEVHVTEGDCRTDGRRELKVRVVMKYDAPATGLPNYVTGTKQPGEPYELQTNLLAFAPIGGEVTGAQHDSTQMALRFGEDHDRQVGTSTIRMLPGETTEIVYTMLGPANVGQPGDVPPTLVVTPGVNPTVTSVDAYRTCAVGGQ